MWLCRQRSSQRVQVEFGDQLPYTFVIVGLRPPAERA
jgi:hypothetical protein